MKNNSRTCLFILCLLLAGCTSNGGEVSYNDYWIINKDGKELLKQGFETVKYCFNGTAIVSKGGKFGTVGTGGRVIVPAEFDSLEYWSDDVLLALKDGSYYVCTAGGRVMESMPSKNEALSFAQDSLPKIIQKQSDYWDKVLDEYQRLCRFSAAAVISGEGVSQLLEESDILKEMLKRAESPMDGKHILRFMNISKEYYRFNEDK